LASIISVIDLPGISIISATAFLSALYVYSVISLLLLILRPTRSSLTESTTALATSIATSPSRRPISSSHKISSRCFSEIVLAVINENIPPGSSSSSSSESSSLLLLQKRDFFSSVFSSASSDSSASSSLFLLQKWDFLGSSSSWISSADSSSSRGSLLSSSDFLPKLQKPDFSSLSSDVSSASSWILSTSWGISATSLSKSSSSFLSFLPNEKKENFLPDSSSRLFSSCASSISSSSNLSLVRENFFFKDSNKFYTTLWFN